MRIRLLAALVWFAAFPCLAAPINTYPAAMTPLSGSEQMIGTQNAVTVNISASQLSTYTKSTINSATITGALGYVPLNPANNLSDVSNVNTSRANLGLGTAAVRNIGVAGAFVPLLNGVNTWAFTQTFTAPIVAPVFTSSVSGITPASGGGTANFLRADGTWAAPSGGGSVTSITAGTGLTGGTITGSGTIGLSTPVAVANGGTGLGFGSGTTLDNVSGFSSTGTIQRTGPGTYAFVNAPTISGSPTPGNCTSWSSSTVIQDAGVTCGGSGNPGGSNTQIQYNNAGVFGGFTLVGDCTLSIPSITCTKTNGSPFAPSAIIDTTNAANISSGLLAVGVGGTGAATFTAHGVIVGEGAGALAVTAPGTSGQVLTSNGAGADPTYQSAGGSVTSVATDATLTGGPCTTTCTLSRAALTGDITAPGASNATTLATVNANTGSFGGAGNLASITVNAKGLITAASQTGLSAALDATFGMAQGDVLYRDSAAWKVLAPGTSGFFLETLGAAANPVWAAASGGMGCTISGGSQYQIVVNNGSSGCSSSANASVQVGALTLGASGTLGTIALGNATSGTMTITPPTGALGTVTVTVPDATDTLVNLAGTQTLTNKSIAGSEINSGTIAGTFVAAANLAASGNGGVTGNLPVTNLNSGTAASGTTFWRGDGTWASPSSTGTVNAGAAGQLGYYATSSNAISGNPSANITGGAFTLGQAGSVVGSVAFANATSGTISLTPPTGALGSAVVTIPDSTDILANLTGTQTLTNKSIAGSEVNSGTVAGTFLAAINLAASGNGGVTGNLPVGNLNSGASASTSTFWRGDGTWAAPPGGVGTVTSVTCNGGLTGGSITSTGTCSLNSPTNHGVLIGQGSSAIAATSAGTAGQVLTSGGSSADPTYQSVNVTTAPLTSISALRALTSANVGSVQQVLKYGTAALGGGTFVYVASDTTSSDDNCTIFVDASSRRWYRQYSGAVNVQWCGAQGDGSTDDTNAIGYALSGFQSVYVPATSSYYKVSGTLTISKQGQTVKGDGPGSTVYGGATPNGTIIETTSASLPVFKISATLISVQISNMLIDRSTTATSGGNGIDSLGGQIDAAIISNVVVQNHWYGLALGPTTNSVVQNAISEYNFNSGVLMLATATDGALQWTLYNVFSENNGTASVAADGVTMMNTSGAAATLGTIYGGATFANSGHGYAAYGVSATYPLSGVRIVGSFPDADGSDEIYLNTYSGYHVINPVLVEGAGTGPTGRGNAVPTSNVGNGINITPNNTDASISAGGSEGNSFSGLLIAASMTGSHVTVSGGVYKFNGVASSAIGLGVANGINIFSALKVAITGVSVFGNYIGLSSNVDVMAISGSDFTGNTSSFSALPGSLTVSCFAGNMPRALNALTSGC